MVGDGAAEAWQQPLLWFTWMQLLPGRTVRDVVAVVSSSGSGGAWVED